MRDIVKCFFDICIDNLSRLIALKDTNQECKHSNNWKEMFNLGQSQIFRWKRLFKKIYEIYLQNLCVQRLTKATCQRNVFATFFVYWYYIWKFTSFWYRRCSQRTKYFFFFFKQILLAKRFVFYVFHTNLHRYSVLELHWPIQYKLDLGIVNLLSFFIVNH